MKILAKSVKITGLAMSVLAGFLGLLKNPFLFLFNNFILRLAVLPLYGRYLRLKNKFRQKTSSVREKIILSFTNRYIIHIAIVMMAAGVLASNLSAYEKNDDYGQNALIYKMVGVEDFDITDTSGPMEKNQIINYVDSSLYLESQTFSEAQQKEDQIYQEQYQSALATIAGGTALSKPNLASTEAAKETRLTVKEYEVAEGDSVAKIAGRFSISVNTILWANNLSATSILKLGQKLLIPPTTGVLHLIKKGDTVVSIAKKYDATETKITEFNRLSKNSRLIAGETIMVPGGRIIYTPKPSAPAYAKVPPRSNTPPVASSGKMAWPSSCKYISQYYRGWIHAGVDIACDWGTSIRAAGSGTVSQVIYGRTGYGYHVIINHGNGIQTLYGHLSRIDVTVGQSVAKGEVIGAEGSTGRSTGPHLHFEVRISGSRVNPFNYIR